MTQNNRFLGVAQLVARYLGVVEAASSSLVTQTRKNRIDQKVYSVFSFLSDSLNLHPESSPRRKAQGGRVNKQKGSGGAFLRRETAQSKEQSKRVYRARRGDYATAAGQRKFKSRVIPRLLPQVQVVSAKPIR